MCLQLLELFEHFWAIIFNLILVAVVFGFVDPRPERVVGAAQVSSFEGDPLLLFSLSALVGDVFLFVLERADYSAADSADVISGEQVEGSH